MYENQAGQAAGRTIVDDTRPTKQLADRAPPVRDVTPVERQLNELSEANRALRAVVEVLYERLESGGALCYAEPENVEGESKAGLAAESPLVEALSSEVLRMHDLARFVASTARRLVL